MMKAEETQAFFNGLASSWDEMEQNPRMEEGIQNFLQNSFAPGARTILDAGCGTGILVPCLLPLYPHAKIIIELDFAEEMLARNQAKFQDRRLVRLAGNATNLPLPDDSMDVILCFNTSPHLGNPETAFRDLFRVLAPGGILAVAHLMSSVELNSFHGNLSGPVAHDRLVQAETMGAVFTSMGGEDVIAQERPGWYFVRARKPS